MEFETITALIDRYGLPIIVVVALTIFIWKWALPKIDEIWRMYVGEGYIKKAEIDVNRIFQTDMEIFRTWEIGYIFNPNYHNQGYATEACQAVINYAFTQLNAHRIVANCSPENPASWRVLEKCGLTREATRRKNAFFRTDYNGEPIWLDSFEYAILADDAR